jgi:hypothetical protein
MPGSSRVWIYQSSRKLNDAEVIAISKTLENFCAQWAAHGSDLQTSFDITHQRFIVLVVNEKAGAPSGCSIDSSTHVIKNLEQQLQIDFFNRSEVAFIEDTDIKTYPLTELKKLFADGRLNENSVTFNALVTTLEEWRNQSKLSVKDSWLKRYIPKIPVS